MIPLERLEQLGKENEIAQAQVTLFGQTVAAIKNPRARRGFLDSFYAKLLHVGIEELGASTIEGAATLLGKYGFKSHAQKLLAHQHYRENALEIDSIVGYTYKGRRYQNITLGLKKVEQGVHCLTLRPGSEAILNVVPVFVPLETHVVPAGDYEIGQRLERIPENAVPLDEFLEITDNYRE